MGFLSVLTNIERLVLCTLRFVAFVALVAFL